MRSGRTGGPVSLQKPASTDIRVSNVLHCHIVTIAGIPPDRMLVTKLKSLVRRRVPDQAEVPVDRLRGADRLVDRDVELGSLAAPVQRICEPMGMAGREVAELLPI